MKHTALSVVVAIILAGSFSVVLADQTEQEIVPDPDPLLDAKKDFPTTFRYKSANRFTTHSGVAPIMNIDPSNPVPELGYIPQINQELDFLNGIGKASNGIFRTPDLPLPAIEHADFTDEFEIKARLINHYSDQNQAWTRALGSVISDANNRITVLGLNADTDDWKLSDGTTLRNSSGERDALIFSYGRKIGDHTFDYSYMKNAGDNIGTPVHFADISNFEAKGHVLEYNFDNGDYVFNARIRRFDIDQHRDNWRNRDWFPDASYEDVRYERFNPATGEGMYESPYCSGGDLAFLDPGNGLCGGPGGNMVPFTGMLAVAPGSPLFDPDRPEHLYTGRLNSRINQEMYVDVKDYRFDIETKALGGTVLFGIEGHRRDIALGLNKDFEDEEEFADYYVDEEIAPLVNPSMLTPGFADPNDPTTWGATARQEWELFGADFAIREDVYSAFIDYTTAFSEKTELYVGARFSRFEQKSNLQINQDGLSGRFLYEVLGLRYIVENTHGVEYTGQSDVYNPFDPEGGQQVYMDGGVDQTDNLFDIVASLKRQLTDSWTVSMTMGYYNEQPNPYEKVFPAPFDPAAASWDGNIYMGNIDLQAEKHKRVEFGAEFVRKGFVFAARAYYEHVDDYIQGVNPVETTNDERELEAYYELACNAALYVPEPWPIPGGVDPLTPLNSPEFTVDGAEPGEFSDLSYMCEGGEALRYSNIDAEIFGFDAAMSYWLTPKLQFTGLLAYQVGKRRDTTLIHNELEITDSYGNTMMRRIDLDAPGSVTEIEGDYLYAMLPPHAEFALSYYLGPLVANINTHLYARQDNVSAAAFEQETSGYGIANILVSYSPHPAIRLDAGVNNVFDREYFDHLGGNNRQYNYSEEGYDMNDKIAGIGRNAFVRLTLGVKWPL